MLGAEQGSEQVQAAQIAAARAPVVLVERHAGVERTAQHTVSQRAVGHDGDLLRRAIGEDLGLHAAVEHVPGVLHDVDSAEPRAFLDLRQAEIGHADEAHLALPDDVVECAHRLFERCVGIGPMHEIDVDVISAEPLQALVDRGEDALPAAVAAVWHFLVADAEFGRDDDVVAAASERPRQRLLGHAHAIGLGRVETIDAAIDRLRDRALELALVNSTIGAADLPTPEADCGNLQAGSPKLPELHRRLSHCAAMAADGVAKRCSMSRRVRNAALSGTSTSAQRRTAPAAMLCLSGTLCASPIGSAPSARLRSAGTSLPQTV